MNWIEHVKMYAKEHGVSYKEALKEAKSTYGGRLVRTKEDEELFDSLYKAGSPIIKVPPQMAFINNKGKKEIINTLTPKLNVSRRNKKKVFNIESNDVNEFKIINGKIYDTNNNELKLKDIKKIIDIDKYNQETENFKMLDEELNSKFGNMNDEIAELIRKTRKQVKEEKKEKEEKTPMITMLDKMNKALQISQLPYSSENLNQIKLLQQQAMSIIPSNDIISKRLYNNKAIEISQNIKKSTKEAIINRESPKIKNKGLNIDFSEFSKDEIRIAYDEVNNIGMPETARYYMSNVASITKDKLIEVINKHLNNNKIDETLYYKELLKLKEERKPRRKPRR